MSNPAQVFAAFTRAHAASQTATRSAGAVPSWVTILLADLQQYGPEALAVIVQIISLFGGTPPVVPPAPAPAPSVDPNA